MPFTSSFEYMKCEILQINLDVNLKKITRVCYIFIPYMFYNFLVAKNAIILFATKIFK